MIGRWVVRLVRALCVCFVIGAGDEASAQSDLAICQAATPQFPQACGCVIERAGQAGIPGPVLSRLLANDVAGVPIAAVQAYGAIYVQCIQEAVLAGVPSAPQPQSPQPQPRAPSTAPITQAAAPSLRKLSL